MTGESPPKEPLWGLPDSGRNGWWTLHGFSTEEAAKKLRKCGDLHVYRIPLTMVGRKFNTLEFWRQIMKKLCIALGLAVLAPAMSLAQDAGQVQEIESVAPQSAMTEVQSDYEMRMAELRAEQDAKMAELRAEQEARMAEIRAEEEARMREEQERMMKIQTERNEKIAELRSELMALESARAQQMQVTGARVVGGQAYSQPMVQQAAPMVQAPMVQSAPAPMVQAPVVEAAPMVAAPVVEAAPIMEAAPMMAPAPVFEAAPIMQAPSIPPVLMQVYGPPTVTLVPIKRHGCLRCRQ